MTPTLPRAFPTTDVSLAAAQPKTAIESTAVQNLGFALLLPYLFFVFSRLSEFVDSDGRAHLVMILALFAGLAVLLTAGIFRAFAAKPGIWLSAFTIWLIVALPFSTWRGGSFAGLTDIWLKSLATYLMAAGLFVTFAHCRRAIFTLALATAVIVVIALKGGLESAADSRLAMAYGTLGNANDLAGQLMMGLPFCLYVAFEKKRNLLLRAGFIVASALLLVVVFKTGSRGGLITILFTAALFFWRISPAGKLKFAVIFLCVVSVAPALLPSDVRDRYGTLFTGRKTNTQVTANVLSAIESEEARRLLLIYAFELTMQHPVFGVGLEQFQNASWDLSIARKEAPSYHPVHNLFALIVSETGIPALCFYMIALVTCFRMLFSIRRATRGRPELEHLSSMAFCLNISLTSFTLCGMFNTNAYSVHFPILAGLIAACSYVARQEIAAAQSNPLPQAVPLAMPWAAARPKARPRVLTTA